MYESNSNCILFMVGFNDVIKGSTPKVFRLFLKCEGKEVEKEKKMKRDVWGGGGVLFITYFGVQIFGEGLKFF